LENPITRFKPPKEFLCSFGGFSVELKERGAKTIATAEQPKNGNQPTAGKGDQMSINLT
jgi:hypothetical protein